MKNEGRISEMVDVKYLSQSAKFIFYAYFQAKQHPVISFWCDFISCIASDVFVLILTTHVLITTKFDCIRLLFGIQFVNSFLFFGAILHVLANRTYWFVTQREKLKIRPFRLTFILKIQLKFYFSHL